MATFACIHFMLIKIPKFVPDKSEIEIPTSEINRHAANTGKRIT